MGKISINQFAVMSVQYFHYSFDYYLKSMKECGIKMVDLWGAIPHYCRLDYPFIEDARQKLNEMKQKMKNNGQKVVVYTPETLAYPYSFSSPDEAVRKRTVDYFAMAMEDALYLGTDKLFINSGCGLLDHFREESFGYLIDTFKRIAKLAEEKGIKLLLEQLQPYESNLVVNLQDVKRVLQEVNSPNFYVCVDVVAMAVAGESLKEYFEELGRDRIQLIHFADSCHYILGDGELPLEKYLKTLEEYEYDGLIDLEINDSIYWENPHESIARSVQWLENYFSK
ncbi:sugar phosphate isomerase/epimerase family protein [Catonella morbi]|nr:TIM barrel protein [Catonella morbi]